MTDALDASDGRETHVFFSSLAPLKPMSCPWLEMPMMPESTNTSVMFSMFEGQFRWHYGNEMVQSGSMVLHLSTVHQSISAHVGRLVHLGTLLLSGSNHKTPLKS